MPPMAVVLSHLAGCDPVLASLVERLDPPTLAPMSDPQLLFARLAQSIISQQISVKAAAAIRQRLQSSLPGAVISPEGIGAASFEELRAVGLSAQKARYLTDLAQKVLSGNLVLERLPEMDDDAVVEQLVKVKGIGRWTAQMFLIFALCRSDVLPVGDLGFRTALKREYGLSSLPEPDEVERLAQPWRPYRTYGAWYLWRSLNNLPTPT